MLKFLICARNEWKLFRELIEYSLMYIYCSKSESFKFEDVRKAYMKLPFMRKPNFSLYAVMHYLMTCPEPSGSIYSDIEEKFKWLADVKSNIKSCFEFWNCAFNAISYLNTNNAFKDTVPINLFHAAHNMLRARFQELNISYE